MRWQSPVSHRSLIGQLDTEVPPQHPHRGRVDLTLDHLANRTLAVPRLRGPIRLAGQIDHQSVPNLAHQLTVWVDLHGPPPPVLDDLGNAGGIQDPSVPLSESRDSPSPNRLRSLSRVAILPVRTLGAITGGLTGVPFGPVRG